MKWEGLEPALWPVAEVKLNRSAQKGGEIVTVLLFLLPYSRYVGKGKGCQAVFRARRSLPFFPGWVSLQPPASSGLARSCSDPTHLPVGHPVVILHLGVSQMVASP